MPSRDARRHGACFAPLQSPQLGRSRAFPPAPASVGHAPPGPSLGIRCPAMADLSPKKRRAALEALSRDRLAGVTGAFNLAVEDRRSVAAHVDAIVRSRSVDFGEVLRQLQRDELKAICDALGLDTSGRKKDAIVERILGGGNGASEDGN